MPEEPPYGSDELVVNLRAGEVAPDDVVLIGLLENLDEGRYRLHGDPTLSRFIDFPEEAIVHIERLDPSDALCARTAVWLRAAYMNAPLEYTETLAPFFAANPDVEEALARTRTEVAGEYGMVYAKPSTGDRCTVRPCPKLSEIA